MAWNDDILNFAARYAGPNTPWGRGEKAFSDAIGGPEQGMQIPNVGDAVYNAPTASELWGKYSNFMRNELPWPDFTLGGKNAQPEPMASQQSQIPPPEIRNKQPEQPPPEIRYKPGKDPRSTGLKSEGFSEFAPGQFYRDDSKTQGPRETRSAFGKDYQVPIHGGTSSMMSVSGDTPMAENLRDRKLGRDIQTAQGQQALQEAQISPQERARLSAKPDVRMSAFQTGLQAHAMSMDAEDQAEARLRAEWARLSPGTNPAPQAIQEARNRASAKFKGLIDFSTAGVTQDRPTMGESFAAQDQK